MNASVPVIFVPFRLNMKSTFPEKASERLTIPNIIRKIESGRKSFIKRMNETSVIDIKNGFEIIVISLISFKVPII